MNEIEEALNPKNTEEEAPKEEVSPTDQKLEKLAQTVENLTSTTANLYTDVQTKLNAPPPPTPVVEEEVDYDEDPQAAMQMEIKKQVDKRATEVEMKLESQRLQETWDKKADEDFPEINPKSQKYDQDVYNKVAKEYQQSFNKAAPDAVYNAASRIKARGGFPKESSSHLRDISARDAGLVGATPRTSVGGESPELSQDEQRIARGLGVDEKKYRQLRNPGGRNV